jgi:GAF domain-containing protein
MKSAPLHPNEVLRLEALRSTNLLDTPSEGKLDFITQMAIDLCETSIALISLVDTDRQWFKSKIGLTVSQTNRDIAFCSHTILQDDIFEVQDTLMDERFHDNPLVVSNPNIRFYAGAPIFSKDQMPIGTLCVIDTQPKTLTKKQKELFAEMAICIGKVIVIRNDMQHLDSELTALEDKKVTIEHKRNDLLFETKLIKKQIY